MSSLAPCPFADYWRPLGESAARKVLPAAFEFARECRALLVACTGRKLADLPWRDPSRALPLDWLDDLAGKPTGPLVDDGLIDLAVDPVRASYERLIPAAVRKRNGEFHTPSFLADRLVAHLSPAAGQGGDVTHFDPCVGGGAFLLALARAGHPMESAFGIDSNPWALLGAAANAARAERARLGRPVPEFQIPVAFADVLAEENYGWPKFDVVLGNPPWLNWDKLSPADRERLAPLWRRYGLFTESGMSAILGGGKKELAGLVILAAIDRFLKPGGRAGFVIPMSLLTARGAGRGFRRFALPDGEPLAALALEDWRATQPFAEAAVHAGLLWLRRGAPTNYPVPVTIIDSNHDEMAASAAPSESDDPLSAWAIGADAERVSLAPLAGKSAYQARLGVNTGGANGLFWFRRLAELGDGRWRMEPLAAGRDPPPAEIVELESDLLYPLLRGKDVRAWRAEPSAWMLLVQDPDRRVGIPVERMQREFPCTLGYLERHERRLRDRAAYRRFFAAREAPFYSQFNVGAYSLAPWKVVWNRLGHRLAAAVVGSEDGKPILPQETHAFFPLTDPDEAHFLAALLNSSPSARALAAWGQRGGKSFATPGAIHRLALPKFSEMEPRHRRLVELARCAAAGDVQSAELDQAVSEMFGLT